MIEWGQCDDEGGLIKGLKAAWGQAVGAIEVELCGVTDRFCGDRPDQTFMGRANEPTYVRTQVLPPRVVGPNGQVDRVMHALMWARNRLGELGRLADIAAARMAEGRHLNEGQKRQWDTLVRRFLSEGSLIRQVLGNDTRWQRTCEVLKGYRSRPWRATHIVHATTDWANLNIEAKHAQHVKR